jgi:hypothetical protein
MFFAFEQSSGLIDRQNRPGVGKPRMIGALGRAIVRLSSRLMTALAEPPRSGAQMPPPEWFKYPPF